MKWKMRKIDLLEFQRATVFCTDGSVHTGTGDCVCDVSEGDGQELEAIRFRDDSGITYVWEETDIERIELLDETT